MKYGILLLGLCLSIGVQAQDWIDGLETRWNGDFREWVIISDSLEGSLEMIFTLNNDITQWRYNIDETVSGTIRRKWQNDPNHWEVRGNDGTIVTARSFMSDNFLYWTITDDNTTIQLRGSIRRNEWQIKNDNGEFVMATDWENDFNVWVMDDTLENTNIHIKMAAVFLGMVHSAFR